MLVCVCIIFTYFYYIFPLLTILILFSASSDCDYVRYSANKTDQYSPAGRDKIETYVRRLEPKYRMEKQNAKGYFGLICMTIARDGKLVPQSDESLNMSSCGQATRARASSNEQF